MEALTEDAGLALRWRLLSHVTAAFEKVLVELHQCLRIQRHCQPVEFAQGTLISSQVRPCVLPRLRSPVHTNGVSTVCLEWLEVRPGHVS